MRIEDVFLLQTFDLGHGAQDGVAKTFGHIAAVIFLRHCEDDFHAATIAGKRLENKPGIYFRTFQRKPWSVSRISFCKTSAAPGAVQKRLLYSSCVPIHSQT